MAPATLTTHEYECLGGPADGLPCTLPAGRTAFCFRSTARWHQYLLQPTDLGLMLVYVGPVSHS